MGDFREWKKVHIPPLWIQIDKANVIASELHEHIAEAHTENFEEPIYGVINLVADEKILIKLWLAAGHWRVIAFAKLRGVTPGSAAWTNVQLTVSAKPSDLYPQQSSFQAAEGNIVSSPLSCTLHVRSAQTMFVTVSASDWGPYPGTLEEFRVVGVLENE